MRAPFHAQNRATRLPLECKRCVCLGKRCLLRSARRPDLRAGDVMRVVGPLVRVALAAVKGRVGVPPMQATREQVQMQRVEADGALAPWRRVLFVTFTCARSLALLLLLGAWQPWRKLWHKYSTPCSSLRT